MTTRSRGLLLALATLGACALAGASARLLADRVDVRGMEIAWESWQNRLQDVSKARRTLAELERRHQAVLSLTPRQEPAAAAGVTLPRTP
jgi:hypothetical protein